MKSGIAIALAWPETYCKQAGGWYDGLLQTLGFNHPKYTPGIKVISTLLGVAVAALFSSIPIYVKFFASPI